MKDKELRPQEPKQPRTVQVKTWLPWMIIILMVTAFTSTIVGWNLRSDVNAHIEARAISLVEQSKDRK